MDSSLIHVWPTYTVPGEIGAASAMCEEPHALGEPQKTVSTMVTTGDPANIGTELSTHSLSDLMEADRKVKKTQLKAKTSSRNTPFQRVKMLLEQEKVQRLQREAKNTAPKKATFKAAPTIPKETTCKAAPTPPKETTCTAATTRAEEATCKAAPAEHMQETTDACTSKPAHPHVPDLDKVLPAKPKDWDIEDPVSAEQQQPAKKRGRKPKAKDTEPNSTDGKMETQSGRKKKNTTAKTTETEESNTDVKKAPRKRPASSSKPSSAEATKPKGKGRKVACKKEEELPSKYEPLELEGDVNLDKGAGFDAYALSCAAADAKALEGQSSSNAGDKDDEHSKCLKETTHANERAEHPRRTWRKRKARRRRKVPDVRRNLSRLPSQQKRDGRKQQKRRPSIVARAVHTRRS